MNRIVGILLLLLIGFSSQAQIYPVQTFIQVSPPYTSYLPDYSNPSNEQLKVFLTLTDMTVPTHEVKIRFRFQGNGYSIENPTYLNLPPIILTPGTPYEISGAELAYYLNSSNLVFSGIDVNDYENRKVLPEGPCTICVEVLDYNSPNNQVVGNPSCTNVWFANYDPPYLNTPICGSEVTVSDPQQLLFNWSPLNMASPSGMNNVEYVFELFEVRPTGADPNIVVNSTLPIFMQVTNQTFVNYSITEPQLQVGMQYVWRVQVRDNSGRDYFKNQGYSQVCTFTYGNLATSVIGDVDFNLQSQGTGVRQGTAWWNSNGVFDSYVLETRKTGNPSYEWFPTGVMGASSVKINSLEPETEYECRVKGVVGTEESEWSNISVFTTQPQPDYSCGNTTMPATSPDIVPYQNATEGMVFFVGQFEMMTTSITPLNTTGHYSGTGKINIPFALINLNVSFDDILVDENLTVRLGKVVAISKGIEAWETDYLNDLCLQNSYPFPGVDTITFPTDSTALVQFGDQTLVIDSLPAAVITPDGYTYYIYEDGTYWVEFSGTISEDNLVSSDTLKIIFQKNPFQNYGFDAFENGLWVDSYETIQLGDGSNYFVPYKSLKSGVEDLVYAKVIAPAGFVLDSISFNCLDGRSLNHVKLNDTIYEITFDQFTAEEEAVYAYWRGGKMGKLNVRAYDEITNEVVLVPVNNASINNQENLNSILNEIYSQAVVTWNMTIDSNFSYAGLGASLESADANLMTHYSPEMRALRDAYLAVHPEIDNSTYILFVVDQFDDPAIQGYMVRGKNVGFLSANPLAKTIAHELGHGAFGLYHTFPTPPEGSTKNLLDYSTQTHLTKYQWEKIHNWSPTLSFLDDEEEGQFAIGHVISDDYGDYIIYSWTPTSPLEDLPFDGFYTPGGKSIRLDDKTQVSNINFDALSGGVHSFKYGAHTYEAMYGWYYYPETDAHVKVFHGYRRSDYQNIFFNACNEPDNFERYDLEERQLAINHYTILKNNPQYFFTACQGAVESDSILILLNENENCAPKIYSYYNDINNGFSQFFNPSTNIYTSPLIGNITGSGTLNIAENKKTLLDEDILGANLTPEQQAEFCQIIQIYNQGDSWGRMYLENTIAINNFSNVYEFLLGYPQSLGDMLSIVSSYHELGHKLFTQYSFEFTNVGTYHTLQEAMEIKFDYMNDMNMNGIHMYASSLASFTETLYQDMEDLRKETDEDLIADIISTHFTNAELEKFDKELRIHIIDCLIKDWMYNGEESVAIRVLKTAPANQSTDILDLLIADFPVISYMTNSVVYGTRLEALFSRINGDENDPFVRCVYKLWANSEYNDSDNPLFSYEGKPTFFDYQSTSRLGFYDSNHNIEIDALFWHVNIQQELPDISYFTPGNPIAGTIASWFFKWAGNDNPSYSYHIYQPIGILDVNQEGEISIPNYIVPAFVLYAFEQVNTNANTATAASTTVDVLSTFVGGVGLLNHFSKLRHLGKLSKLSKLSTSERIFLGVKTVEFTSGTANMILNYACEEQSTWCNELKSILTLVEIASLSGDAIYGQMLKHKSKAFIDNTDNISHLDDAPNGNEIKRLLVDLADEIDLSWIDDLPNWSDELKNALKNDLINNPQLFANVDNVDGAEAWKLLRSKVQNPSPTNMTYLFRNQEALEAVAVLRTHPKRLDLGLTDNIIKNINGHSNSSFSELVNDLKNLCDFVNTYPSTSLVNFDSKILNVLTGTIPNKRQGVHWIIKDLGNDPLTFGNKSITFEVPTPNARGNTSYIDLEVVENGVQKLKVEYKWGEGSITSSTIKDQFIERDLFGINDLSEIQWRIKGYDLTKTDLTDWLSQFPNEFGTDEIIQLFNNFAHSNGFPDDIYDFASLIEFIESNDDWYNLVFKITQ